MKKIIVLIIVAGTLLSLYSCSSSNAMIHDYQDFPEPDQDKGIIYFYRPSKFAAAALNNKIYLKGKLIAESINGKYSYIILPPDDYNISLDSKIKNIGLVLTVEANKKYYIKNEYTAKWANILFIPIIFSDPQKNFETRFEVVPEKVGKEEIKSCKYVTFNFDY